MSERTRHFWRTMIYACDLPGCGAEHVFLLEDGCEGPRVQSMQGVFGRTSPLAGQPVTVWLTAGAAGVARLVVPVPMIAGRCRSCVGGTRPGRFGPVDGGYLRHVRWNEDTAIDLTVEGEPDTPYFAYPSNGVFKRDRDRACGRPVFPAEGVAGDGR